MKTPKKQELTVAEQSQLCKFGAGLEDHVYDYVVLIENLGDLAPGLPLQAALRMAASARRATCQTLKKLVLAKKGKQP